MLNITERSGIVVIELDRGKVNALDHELLQVLTVAFEEADRGQAVVLTGAGRAFSAGVDLRRIGDSDDASVRQFIDALSACFLSVFDHPAPVVAAINGPAIAGGCVIAAACDRRLMSEGSIGLAELSVGVPFPSSALEIMRSVLGPRTANLVLTARLLDAEEALAVGLVDEVVAPDELIEQAVKCATGLSKLPPGVFALTKSQLHRPTRERIAADATGDQAVSELWLSEPVRSRIREHISQLGQR